MKKVLKIILIISGVFVIIIPIVISLLWGKYSQDYNVTKAADSQVEKCTPYDFKITSVDSDKVSVTWQTVESCTGYILLSAEPGTFTQTSEKIVPNEGSASNTKFSASVPKSEIKTNGYMVIVSNDVMYGLNESSIRIASSIKN